MDIPIFRAFGRLRTIPILNLRPDAAGAVRPAAVAEAPRPVPVLVRAVPAAELPGRGAVDLVAVALLVEALPVAAAGLVAAAAARHP